MATNTQVSGATVYPQPRDCSQFDQNALTLQIIRDVVAQFQLDYDSAETYGINDLVLYQGHLFQSLVAGNTNNTPSTSPTQWQQITAVTAVTNLAIANQTTTSLDVTSSTGNDATLSAATGSNSGLQSATDKTNHDALIIITGVSGGDLHLGTFTGSTIQDSRTIKLAIQDLETALEALSGTNLSISNQTSTTLEIASSNGTNAIVPQATGSNAGLMTATDKTKLDGLGGPSGSGTPTQDNLTSGVVTADVERDGLNATTLTNPGTGEYNIIIPSGSYFRRATVFANNTVLNSGAITLSIDNSANSKDRRVSVQIYQASDNALVDQKTTGTLNSQITSGNVTILAFPANMGNFGSSGFYVEIS